MIADRAEAFDQVEAGYTGPLYAEISPRTFPVLVRTGSRLSQIRFRRGQPRLNEPELAALHARSPLVNVASPSLLGGVAVSVDLSGFDGLIGYRAKRHTGLVDVDAPGKHRVDAFWERLPSDGSASLILDPGQFYILASKEAVQVRPITPRRWCRSIRWSASSGSTTRASSIPASAMPGRGARAPGQCWRYAPGTCRSSGRRADRRPPRLRAHERGARDALRAGAGSNYQAQGLKLSKHFV